MYWSGCHSTAAEMTTYLTAAGLAGKVADDRGAWRQAQWQAQWRDGCGTYGYRPAAGRRCCLAAGFAVRLGRGGRSQARQSVPEVGPSGWWETCCAATRPSVDGCLGPGRSDVGDVMGGSSCGNARGKRGEGPARLEQQELKRKAKEISASDGLRCVK